MSDENEPRSRVSPVGERISRPGRGGRWSWRGAWLLAAVACAMPLAAHAANAKAGAASATDVITSLKQKALQEAVSTLLDHQLPLKLDASSLYPAVNTLPGAGPFNPMRFKVTADNWDQPLPPGDYVVRAVAFCSEYSVHRGGAGAAYQVGPVQGKAADAISTLLWRGTVVKRRTPHDLQKVSWAIQAGLSYAKMGASYRAIIDEVIPEFRGRLGADFVENLQDLYAARAKDLGLPTLHTVLAQMGKAGELVLAANRQREALLRKNTTEERRDQILFAGQEHRIAPMRAAQGPWSVIIPGVAYVRYRVVGGNMKANNEIQIRILPQTPTKVGAVVPMPRGVFGALAPESSRRVAAAAAPKPRGPTLYELTKEGIGYAVSRASQILYFAPAPAPGGPNKNADAIGRITNLQGTVNLTRNGETRPLTKDDMIQADDTISTGGDGKTQVEFSDQSTLGLGPNTTLPIDAHVYDPTNPDANGSSYSWMEGQFRYVSGLIAKKENSDFTTVYGNLGIRGTEFIGRYLPNAEALEIHLISGSLLLSPKEISTSTLVTAPVSVRFSADAVTTTPLTRRAYNGQAVPILIR
ncbi:MAG: FecR domain-containing protein [Opitutaceae bacterium]|nr:FecR domain-containing protein [Opitutaceae bacterium]